ncbi:MAG TPA: DUF2130 domain-containing protein [Opitutaceae bacterium]|jgi:hypothetical protein|nr:DUF2130 domain-containing protein [Opitutaceae bacterium]HPO01306.1 DUF2130 domain-containing protein [Opitutaceae bacterium]
MPTTDALITCPHCHQAFPLNEAVLQQHRDTIERELREKTETAQRALRDREQALASQTAALEQRQQTLATEVQRQLATERQKLRTAAVTEAREQLAVELRDTQARLGEQTQQLEKARATELALRQERRALEEQKAALELDVARRLDAERQKLLAAAEQKAEEAQRLRLAEKEKVISDMQAQIAVLKQKAEQGSMQLQGDVLEIDLEHRLAALFPADEIVPVATGTRGADIQQLVRTTTAQPCGLVIWETKRTKNWSAAWPAKLKEDQRTAKATLAVLVTQALPEGVRGFTLHEGVWVCDYASALPLAQVLRQWLIALAVARAAESGKQEKTALLYAYLTGAEFRQHIEGVVSAFKTMRDDLEAEKRALQKHWARREKELDRAIGCTASLYGSIQGIAGAGALPDIEPLLLGEAS